MLRQTTLANCIAAATERDPPKIMSGNNEDLGAAARHGLLSLFMVAAHRNLEVRLWPHDVETAIRVALVRAGRKGTIARPHCVQINEKTRIHIDALPDGNNDHDWLIAGMIGSIDARPVTRSIEELYVDPGVKLTKLRRCGVLEEWIDLRAKMYKLIGDTKWFGIRDVLDRLARPTLDREWIERCVVPNGNRHVGGWCLVFASTEYFVTMALTDLPTGAVTTPMTFGTAQAIGMAGQCVIRVDPGKKWIAIRSDWAVWTMPLDSSWFNLLW